jgi:hypothetical protein
LVAHGLAGFESNRSGSLDHADMPKPHPETCPSAPLGAMGERKPFTYEPPSLVGLNARIAECKGDTPCQTGSAPGQANCWPGASAGQNCQTGTSAGGGCLCTGTSPASANNCQVGNCPQAFSQTCSPGGILCNSGGSAVRCTTCDSGGNPIF